VAEGRPGDLRRERLSIGDVVATTAEVIAGPETRRDGRSPALVYTALSAALVVLLAVLTITAAQTAPPAIAELAPAAVEQIKDAPPSQTSSVGEGEGGSASGGGATTTTVAAVAPTLPPEVRVAPRTRRCITAPGSLPRQTEDPQSPPCVALWEGGDNGGATSKGVTRDEITIAVPAFDGQLSRAQRAYETYFNKRFELYGRKLRLVPFKPAPDYTTGDKMQGDAVFVDEQVNAFASLGYNLQQGQENVYYDALARRGIVSVSANYAGPSRQTEKDLTAHAPYEWSYYQSLDIIERHLAELICKQLVGKRAAFAGGSEAVKDRRFGLIVDATVRGGTPIDGEPLLGLTRRCGAQWSTAFVQFADASIPNAAIDGNKTPIAQFRGDGVTSIVCLCLNYELRGAQQDAYTSSPPYLPEWVINGYGLQDSDYQGGTSWVPPSDQNVFGLRSYNKSQPREAMPFWKALREVDPTFPEGDLNVDWSYWNLLVLASGIQLAGPNLTAESFQQGLQRTHFPNPGCGGPPDFQACVGFEGGSHTMIKDTALVWWDPNQPSVEYDYAKTKNQYASKTGRGAYCYADLGVRRTLGSWPKQDPPIFNGRPCR
jgi:hypothetical protein